MQTRNKRNQTENISALEKKSQISSKVKDGENAKFECKLCSKQFSRRDTLTAHLFRHTGERPFKCKQCGQMFSMKSYLDRHMVSHSGKKEFSCDICGKRFGYRSGLNEHRQLHREGEPTFSCSKCEKVFRTKGTYNQHMLLHKDSSSHVTCNVCGKHYTCRAYLNKHMHIHKGTKRFHCDQCQKGFLNKQAYDEHMVRHSGTKKIQCEHCGRRYFTSRELKKHLVYHTNVTCHNCDVCKMYFNTSIALIKHNVKSHPKCYRCNRCSETFRDKRKLAAHTHQKHGESMTAVLFQKLPSEGHKLIKNTSRVDDLQGCVLETSLAVKKKVYEQTERFTLSYEEHTSNDIVNDLVCGKNNEQNDVPHQKGPVGLEVDEHCINLRKTSMTDAIFEDADFLNAKASEEEQVLKLFDKSLVDEECDNQCINAGREIKSVHGKNEPFEGHTQVNEDYESNEHLEESKRRALEVDEFGRTECDSGVISGAFSSTEKTTLDKVNPLEQNLDEFPALDFDDLREEMATEVEGFSGEVDIERNENMTNTSTFTSSEELIDKCMNGANFPDMENKLRNSKFSKYFDQKDHADKGFSSLDSMSGVNLMEENTARQIDTPRSPGSEKQMPGDAVEILSCSDEKERHAKDIVQQSIEQHFNERMLPGSDLLIFVDDDGSVVGYQSQSDETTGPKNLVEGSAANQEKNTEIGSQTQTQRRIGTFCERDIDMFLGHKKYSNCLNPITRTVRPPEVIRQVLGGSNTTVTMLSSYSDKANQITGTSYNSTERGANIRTNLDISQTRSGNHTPFLQSVNNKQSQRMKFNKIAPKTLSAPVIVTGEDTNSIAFGKAPIQLIQNPTFSSVSSPGNTSSSASTTPCSFTGMSHKASPHDTAGNSDQSVSIGSREFVSKQSPLRSLLDRSKFSNPTIIPKQPRKQHQSQRDQRQYKYEIVIENLGEVNEKISLPREIKKSDVNPQQATVREDTEDEVSLDDSLPKCDTRADFQRFENVLKAKLCRMEGFLELDGFLERMESSFRTFRARRQQKRLESKYRL